jgi:hypothetical protein
LLSLFDDLASGRDASLGWAPRALGFDRILVLFTRVDMLCDQAELCRLCPRELARRLDPIAQAIDLVGETTLAMALSSMRPGAQLGVAFVSAGGFNARTGVPFLDARGIPAERSTTDDLLRHWQPFGILAAAEFLAWGRTGDTVRALDRRTLAAQHKVRWVAAGTDPLSQSSPGSHPHFTNGDMQ